VTLLACLDVGSTFTKGCLVDTSTGELIATATHPTTVSDDVQRGIDAVLGALGDADDARACSSAGGGLRLAVVGHQRAITAEAGRLVGLTAGARIVHVSAGPLDVAALSAARPDLVLLVGGTDGGDTDSLLANAAALAGCDTPIVLAGNADARDRAAALLTGAHVITADNVLPRIGDLRPGPARAAVRTAFLRHVIGGKHLSASPRFAQLVRGATPDLVLTGVQVLARAAGCDVLVLDVGGATTDVYSALTLHDAPGAAGALPLTRTVEGDLGVRWTAPGTVEAAALERLPVDDELRDAAARRAAHPGALPHNQLDRAADSRLAALAATIALRRHTRPSTSDHRRDLRAVRLVVGSGGVLRHDTDGARVLRAALTDTAGGHPLPERPRCPIDQHGVLAAVGLLADDHPAAAAALAATVTAPTTPDTGSRSPRPRPINTLVRPADTRPDTPTTRPA
jgi:uncharacterized protein (TIGR01319 family)